MRPNNVRRRPWFARGNALRRSEPGRGDSAVPAQPDRIASRTSGPVRKLDRSLLPQPADHYARLFGPLRFNPAGWAQVRCVFHEDHRASLSLHREKGAYRCFGCDARGGDLLDHGSYCATYLQV